MKKVGIYGGTFDPIHHGHLLLARAALEQFALDKLIFVPAALSPHKLLQQPAAAALRLQMLRAAVDGEQDYEIDLCELERPGPSYAIDTVEWMLRENPTRELYYFIGADNVAALSTWHRIDELRQLVQFVALARTGILSTAGLPTVCQQIDISATEIRKRVAAGLSIRYLVPPAVEQIIHLNHLYEGQTSPKNN